MADYIDRAALRKDLTDSVVFTVKNNELRAELRGARKIINRIEAAPTVDAVPVVHGWWNADETCSCCGEKSTEGLDAEKWNYWFPDFCPHCGAKMDLKEINK